MYPFIYLFILFCFVLFYFVLFIYLLIYLFIYYITYVDTYVLIYSFVRNFILSFLFNHTCASHYDIPSLVIIYHMTHLLCVAKMFNRTSSRVAWACIGILQTKQSQRGMWKPPKAATFFSVAVKFNTLIDKNLSVLQRVL